MHTNLLHRYTGFVIVPELNQSQREHCRGQVWAFAALQGTCVWSYKSRDGDGLPLLVHFKIQPHSHLQAGICLIVQIMAGVEHVPVVWAREEAGL